METVRQVVVGFDGSTEAAQALTWAADAAARHHATLLVVVATGDPSYGGYSPLIVPGDVTAEQWAAQARDLLATAGRVGRVAVARNRLPQRALLDASSASTLLVVGARGHGQVAGAVLGSVSLPVAKHARGPVAVVRPAADPDAERIVIGLDGSPPSIRALDFAMREAVGTGRHVVAVRACRPGMHRATERGGMPAADGVPEVVADAAHRFPGVHVELTCVSGSAGDALVDASQHADLVVVGTGHRHGLDVVVPGSVSLHVLHEAACTVAVIP